MPRALDLGSQAPALGRPLLPAGWLTPGKSRVWQLSLPGQTHQLVVCKSDRSVANPAVLSQAGR